MMIARVIFIIVMVVLLGALVYVFHSGVKGPNFGALGHLFSASSSSFSFFTPPPDTSTIRSGGSSYISSGGGSGGGADGSGANPSKPTISPYEIPQGFTLAELSPYFHEVRLSGVSAASLYSYGQIGLYAGFGSATTTIDITGWQVKANNGNEYIPRAVNLYDPSGLAPETDIELKRGDYVYLYSSSAPFNLRLNECAGYMAHVANFTPSIPPSCPAPDYSALHGFSGACQNFIQSIGSCQMPDFNSPSLPRNDYSCENYLQTHYTYRSCFENHVNDPNFLSNQIWVWMGSSPIDQYHDRVLLLDRNGLLVDEYTY